MTTRKHKAFTLIELIISMAILTVLAALLWSAYEKQNYKKYRFEAIAALTRAAQELERQHSDFGVYSSANVPAESEFRNYAITVTNPCVGGNRACYVITATAQGSQAGDADCVSFSLDNFGKRTFTGAGSSCWSE